MEKIKFVFIVNDIENRAFNFLSRFKNGLLSFDRNRQLNGLNLNGLLNYGHAYSLGKYLFLDDCSFGNTNNEFGPVLLWKLSQCIYQYSETNRLSFGWVYIRITNYEGKKQTIDNLLKRFFGKDEKVTINQAIHNEKYQFAHFINFGRTIILNECFIDSRYTMFGNNISHEVINCFKTDNEERYLYLCSDGGIQRERFYKAGYDNIIPIDYIDDSKIAYIDYSKTGKDGDNKAQYVFLRKVNALEALDSAFDKFLEPNKYSHINYGGKNIINIFEANSYSGNVSEDSIGEAESEKDNAVTVYATFKAINNECYKPGEPVSDAIVLQSDDLGKLKGQTMHQYVIEGCSFFDRLCEKIDAITWEHEDVPTLDEYLNSNLSSEDNIPDTVLGVIDRLKRETHYSDLLAYVFSKSPIILNKFLEKAGINNRVDPGCYEVEREFKNIDIFIKNNHADNKFLLVLENKIEASFSRDELNTWDSFVDDKKRNEEIVSKLEDEKKEYLNTNHDKKMNCQLPKYYLLAKYIAKLNKVDSDDDHVKCFIVCPEQYVDSYNSSKNEYGYGEKYSVISYKTISESISEVLDNNLDHYLEPFEISLIEEIQRSLAVHISKSNVLFVLRNRHRFARSVINLRRINHE